jgi:prepilin-type N-terminal cleavage/methylation domain-containing protein
MKNTQTYTFRPKAFVMFTPAFTMLELIFVMIVIGILAALVIPRMERDLKQEASNSILSAIRYTQQLALKDNKHRFNQAKWQQRYWKIMFGTCSQSTDKFFMIGSDNNMNNGSFFDQNESAVDPLSSKPYFWVNGQDCSDGGDGTVSNQIFLTHKYGINSFAFAGGCNNVQYIGFDHLGRPHVGFGGSTSPDFNSYMTNTCTISFTMDSGDTFSIRIEPETGHAQIVGQPDS